MTPRAGLLMEEGRLTLAVVSSGGNLECLALDPADNPGAQLAGELDRRGFKRGRLRVGLDRNLVVVKELEMPRVGGASFGEMVRFELELYVPFEPEHMASDWSINPGKVSATSRCSAGSRGAVAAVAASAPGRSMGHQVTGNIRRRFPRIQ